MLVADPAALGAALAKTTLRQRQERPLVADQRRLAEALLPGGKQAFDIHDLLAPPQAPTKIVVGIEDRITPARHAEGLNGLIALHRFPRVGHMPHLEARREVARLVEELVRAGGGVTYCFAVECEADVRRLAIERAASPLKMAAPEKVG